jgi:hypothetical protein
MAGTLGAMTATVSPTPNPASRQCRGEPSGPASELRVAEHAGLVE